MTASILSSTKKVLGIAESYTAFDVDIVNFINSSFSIVAQLGVGPAEGFSIEDETAEWTDFDATPIQLNMVRTYIFLRVRLLFDPPTTSFLIDAMTKQVEEYEWRLNLLRENDIPLPIEEVPLYENG